MSQPEVEAFDAIVSICSDVYLPLTLAISDSVPVRFVIVHSHQR
jgi:hypothetical protein